MTPVDLSVTDLQRLHLHHLRHGPEGVAADLETLADLRSVPVSAVVFALEEAAREGDDEAAGWARFVVFYVRAAIDAGTLDVDGGQPASPRSQIGRSDGSGR